VPDMTTSWKVKIPLIIIINCAERRGQDQTYVRHFVPANGIQHGQAQERNSQGEIRGLQPPLYEVGGCYPQFEEI